MQHAGLQWRIVLFVSAGMVVLWGAFALLLHVSAEASRDLVLGERLSLAKTTAGEVDLLLLHEQAELARHAASISSDLGQRISSEDELNLRSLYEHLRSVHRFRLPAGIMVTNTTGNVLWSYGAEESFTAGEALPFAENLGASSRGIAVDDTHSQWGPLIWISAAVRDSQGVARGWLATAVAPTMDSPTFYGFRPHQNQNLELITFKGDVIIGPMDRTPSETAQHLEILSGLIEANKPGAVRHSEHLADGRTEDHMVAFAPLADLPWGVVLEEKQDAALTLPWFLERQVLILSLSALVVGLLLAWLTTHRVVRPLALLTASCQRIADGDLGTPVQVQGPGEVKDLSSSLEAMRIKLKQSMERIEGWGKELETRVNERTKKLSEQSREKEVLLQKLMSAQEEERKRVARELHDEVGQDLSALVMYLGSIEQALEKDTGLARARLMSFRGSVAETIEDVRRLIYDLRPSVLDDMGLIPAVTLHAENRLRKQGIEVQLSAKGFNGRLPPHIELAIFRVMQEAMNNLARHAKAKAAWISLEMTDGVIQGLVRDDGIGFDVAVGRDSSVGIMGMEERVSRLGGRLYIESAPSKGTTMRFEVPYHKETGHGEDKNTDS